MDYPMPRNTKNAMWKSMHADRASETERLIIPGGWLYRTVMWSDENIGSVPSVAMVFVLDPDHLLS